MGSIEGVGVGKGAIGVWVGGNSSTVTVEVVCDVNISLMTMLLGPGVFRMGILRFRDPHVSSLHYI